MTLLLFPQTPVEDVDIRCPAHDCITVDGRCQRCLEEAVEGVYLITDYPEIVAGRGGYGDEAA